MKKIYSLLMTMALAFGLVSCSDNWSNGLDGSNGDTGKLSTDSLTLEVSQAEDVVNSRDGSSVDVSNFIVSIANKETGIESATWKYSEMPEIVVLPVGTYTITVKSHEVEKQAWDKPYYTGSGEVTIVKDAVTPAGVILCRFSSIRVTIEYTPQLLARLAPGAAVNVVANDNGRLSFSTTETRSGYFEAVEGSNTIVATFNGTLLTSEGVPEANPTVFTRSYTDAAPGKHYRITYKLKTNSDGVPEETGSVSTGVEIDAEIDEVNNDAEIDWNDEDLDPSGRPEQGDEPSNPGIDPSDPPTPPAGSVTFTSSTLNLDAVNQVTAGMTAIVTISAPANFKHIKVNIASDNDAFIASVGDVLPLSFDLCEPGDLAEALGEDGLGFKIGDEVKALNTLDFDISNFMLPLAGFPGNHTFTIDVEDQDGNTATLVLKLKV